ncbi:TPA: hypothetical protein ROY01_002903 [Bacillus toyonensis]|nr:hypothetical protein [Bacillus toyonensis]
MKNFQIELHKLPTENTGEIILSIDESIVFQEKTDIIDLICQFFDAWVEFFKYDDATIFLDEYEKKVEFKNNETA